jgi:thiamine biosynthesis protein ThiS
VSGGLIRVRVNGVARELSPDTSVSSLLIGDTSGAAVARNREVVPRAQWALTFLADGDEVEVVRPVQGGAW